MKSQLETLHKRVAGIDVHRMKPVVSVLIEDEAGNLTRQTREYGVNVRPPYIDTVPLYQAPIVAILTLDP